MWLYGNDNDFSRDTCLSIWLSLIVHLWMWLHDFFIYIRPIYFVLTKGDNYIYLFITNLTYKFIEQDRKKWKPCLCNFSLGLLHCLIIQLPVCFLSMTLHWFLLEFWWSLSRRGGVCVRGFVYVFTVYYYNQVNLISSAWDIWVVNLEILCQASTLAKIHFKINLLIICLDYQVLTTSALRRIRLDQESLMFSLCHYCSTQCLDKI